LHDSRRSSVFSRHKRLKQTSFAWRQRSPCTEAKHVSVVGRRQSVFGA
jgi:hypothetical protein